MTVWLILPAKLTSMLTMQTYVSMGGKSVIKHPSSLALAVFTYNCIITVCLRILK